MRTATASRVVCPYAWCELTPEEHEEQARDSFRDGDRTHEWRTAGVRIVHTTRTDGSAYDDERLAQIVIDGAYYLDLEGAQEVAAAIVEAVKLVQIDR